jgi:hypothetical protein
MAIFLRDASATVRPVLKCRNPSARQRGDDDSVSSRASFLIFGLVRGQLRILHDMDRNAGRARRREAETI